MRAILFSRLRILGVAGALSALSVFTSPAMALVIVTVTYEGTVTKVGSGLSSGPISVGDDVSGQVSYTAPAADTFSGGERGNYASVIAHTYQAGSYSGDITNVNSGIVSIFDDYNFCTPIPCLKDGFSANAVSGPAGLGAGAAIAGMLPQVVQLALGSSSTSLLSSDALLDEVSDFAPFSALATPGSWALIFGSTGSTTTDVRATIASFDVSVSQVDVPEPHPMALLPLGLILFGLARRKVYSKL